MSPYSVTSFIMAMDGPGMGDIPPAILDDIMRTSHVVGHFNGESSLTTSEHTLLV